MNGAVPSDRDVVVVLCTAPRALAEQQRDVTALARQLVAERLCACVNVVDGVTSHFWWDGKVDTATEYLLVVKTTRAAVERLRQRFCELHPYEVPEFLVLEPSHGLPAYLQWVAATVAGRPE